MAVNFFFDLCSFFPSLIISLECCCVSSLWLLLFFSQSFLNLLSLLLRLLMSVLSCSSCSSFCCVVSVLVVIVLVTSVASFVSCFDVRVLDEVYTLRGILVGAAGPT